MRRRLVNLFLSELHLEGRPHTRGRFDDGIDFEPRVVSIVAHHGVVRLGVYPQVADDQRLEQKAEPLDLVEQPHRRGAQGRHSQCRIHEMPLRCGPQDGTGAQMRRPRGLVFDDHQSIECCQILSHRVVLERSIRSSRVARKCADGHRGRHVARERGQQAADAVGITAHVVDTIDVYASDLVEVAAHRLKRLGMREHLMTRPAADRHPGGDVLDGEPGIGTRAEARRQQRFQRDGARRVAGLMQAHGTHAEPSHSGSARVPRDVVRWNRRSGEDELSRLRPIVDGATNVIPDRRFDLPLVDEAWHGAGQHGAGREGGRRAGVGVHVQQHFTSGDLASGLGFSARFGTLDHDGARCLKAKAEFAVHDARQIGHDRSPRAGQK